MSQSTGSNSISEQPEICQAIQKVSTCNFHFKYPIKIQLFTCLIIIIYVYIFILQDGDSVEIALLREVMNCERDGYSQGRISNKNRSKTLQIYFHAFIATYNVCTHV